MSLCKNSTEKEQSERPLGGCGRRDRQTDDSASKYSLYVNKLCPHLPSWLRGSPSLTSQLACLKFAESSRRSGAASLSAKLWTVEEHGVGGGGGSTRTGPPTCGWSHLPGLRGASGVEAEAAASVGRKRRSYCRSALSPPARSWSSEKRRRKRWEDARLNRESCFLYLCRRGFI